MSEKAFADHQMPGQLEAKGLGDPATWVDEFGDYLFRYALCRERDRESAEDLVQETFLAALRNRDSFSGQSSPRTWLVGILKRKLVDKIRDRERRPLNDAAGTDVVAALFTKRGNWRQNPHKWGKPEANLQRQEFWEALDRCLSRLPARMSAAFTMRELEELASEHVRTVLGVSPGNLNVLLHRARLGLSLCLDLDWFATCGKED
jgi:RNA polymerase sigma-70 factor (TIGR02943 family)